MGLNKKVRKQENNFFGVSRDFSDKKKLTIKREKSMIWTSSRFKTSAYQKTPLKYEKASHMGRKYSGSRYLTKDLHPGYIPNTDNQ